MDKLFDNIILPVMTTVTTFFVSWLCSRAIAFLNNRIHMNITKEQEAKIDTTIENAIYAVEEKSASDAKQGIKHWAPIEKHNWAINFIMRFVPKVDPKKIEDLLTAKLGSPYIEAGATDDHNKKC